MTVAVDGGQGNAQETDSIGAVPVPSIRQVEGRREAIDMSPDAAGQVLLYVLSKG